MASPMGRRRQSNLDLPARMYFRRGRYYWGHDNIALGADKRVALHRYAELETGGATPGTFADAAINIEYCYCSAGGKNGKTVGIFKVNNTDKAVRLLNGPVSVAMRRRLEGRAMRDRRSYTPR